jgi:hypothetical protein
MKKILLTFSLFAAQILFAQEADIKKSITTFFDGLHAGDTIKIQSVCSKHLLLQSIADKPERAKLSVEDKSEFYESIGALPKGLKIEERLLDYKIQIDGPMAHVWTPYEFYIDGKLSHKGVNSFQLFNDNGVWKIVYIIDTRRK